MITFDSHAEKLETTGPDTTFSFTNAGNYLFVNTPVTCNSVTYNGVSMSVLQSFTPTGSPFGANCPPIRVWGLANPYIGTANIVTSGFLYQVSSASYFLVDEGTQPENSGTADSHAGQQLGTSAQATVSTDGGWVIGFTRHDSFRSCNAQSGTTIRSDASGSLLSGSSVIFDLNTSESPGTYTSGVDLSSGTAFFSTIVMAIVPQPESITGNIQIL